MNQKGTIVIGLIIMLILGILLSGLVQQTYIHILNDRAVRRHRQVVNELQTLCCRELHDLRAAMLQSRELPGSEIKPGRILVNRSFRTILLNDFGQWRKQRTYCQVEVANTRFPFSVRAEGSVDVLSGLVPLDRLDRLIGSETTVQHPKSAKIGRAGSLSEPTADWRFDSDGYIRRQLRLESVENPWNGLRGYVHLEANGLPLIQGIYLLVSQGELLGVWVEGDLDSLRISCAHHTQELCFQQGSRAVSVAYVPELPGSCRVDRAEGGLTFGERIFVDGSIANLQESSSPSLLQLSNLVVIASGIIHVQSCIGQTPRLPDQRKKTSLNLIACRKRFFRDEKVDASVVIDIPEFCSIAARVLVQGALVILDSGMNLVGGLAAETVKGSAPFAVQGLESALGVDEFFIIPHSRLPTRFQVHYLMEGDDET